MIRLVPALLRTGTRPLAYMKLLLHYTVTQDLRKRYLRQTWSTDWTRSSIVRDTTGTKESQFVYQKDARQSTPVLRSINSKYQAVKDIFATVLSAATPVQIVYEDIMAEWLDHALSLPLVKVQPRDVDNTYLCRVCDQRAVKLCWLLFSQ